MYESVPSRVKIFLHCENFIDGEATTERVKSQCTTPPVSSLRPSSLHPVFKVNLSSVLVGGIVILGSVV